MKSSSLCTIILLIALLIICEVNLLDRVQNYQIKSKNMTTEEMEKKSYKLHCSINPICNITLKGLMTDPINFYIYHPAAVIVNTQLKLSEVDKNFPYTSINDAISIIHVFIGLIGCAFISSEKLRHRRIGTVIFEFAILLDCLGELIHIYLNNFDIIPLDGVVARAAKDEFGERSNFSSRGYFVDGFCDTIVIIYLLIAIKCLLYQKKNLPISSKDTVNVQVHVVMLYLILNILFSVFFWNQFIISFESLFDKYGGKLLRSSFFLTMSFLWKTCSCYSIIHMVMVAIYRDKLMTFLKKFMLLIMALIFIACIIGEIILIAG